MKVVHAPLISVIVPIYNVAPYVAKCLESLKKQTMREIEVICIDDGSTDESGKIADEYAKDDERFRVIHTENCGLSAARNRGIDESLAEWIMFVDSDDWVSKEFCRIPHENATRYAADLVVFNVIQSKENGRIKCAKRKEETDRYTDFETLIDESNTVAWNKLYKKELFKGVRYPEGHVYEDVATTHKLIYKANRIYKCSDNLYFHRNRKGSISRSNESRIDEYRAKTKRSQELVDMGYSKSKSDQLLWEASLAYCGHAACVEDPLYREAENVLKTVPGIPQNGKQKGMLMIWKLNPKVYRGIYLMLGKRMDKVTGSVS